jgi:serine/threonine protein phosphatase PrpC
LLRAAAAANAEVFALSNALGQAGEMGTTLVAAVLRDGLLYWLSSGDSGLFLFREGELTQLNVPHVYSRQLDAKAVRGEISREEALGDPQREALTSYLGLPEIAEIDVTRNGFPLRPSDLILLASDGLFKTLPPRDIAALLGGPGAEDLQGVCEKLVETALGRQRRGQDNVTVIGLAAETWRPAAPPAAWNGINRLEEARTAFENGRTDREIQRQQARQAAQAAQEAAPPPPKTPLWKVLLPVALAGSALAAGYYYWTAMCCAPPPVRQENAPAPVASGGDFDPDKRPPAFEERAPGEEPRGRPRPVPARSPSPEAEPRGAALPPPLDAPLPAAPDGSRSLVRISRKDSAGLGFFLGPRHVLTTPEACCPESAAGRESYQVRTRGGTVLFGRPVLVDRKLGIAVLLVPESEEAHPLTLAREAPRPGEESFPLGEAAGAPVVNACGEVFALHRVMKPGAAPLPGESRILLTGEAVKELKKKDVPFRTASGKCTGGRSK